MWHWKAGFWLEQTFSGVTCIDLPAGDLSYSFIKCSTLSLHASIPSICFAFPVVCSYIWTAKVKDVLMSCGSCRTKSLSITFSEQNLKLLETLSGHKSIVIGKLPGAHMRTQLQMKIWVMKTPVCGCLSKLLQPHLFFVNLLLFSTWDAPKKHRTAGLTFKWQKYHTQWIITSTHTPNHIRRSTLCITHNTQSGKGSDLKWI